MTLAVVAARIAELVSRWSPRGPLTTAGALRWRCALAHGESGLIANLCGWYARHPILDLRSHSHERLLYVRRALR